MIKFKFNILLIVICIVGVIFTSCSLRNEGAESDVPIGPESESSVETADIDTDTESESQTEEPDSNYNAEAYLGSKLILIDAGHGFGDPGCSSSFMNGRNESEIAYEVAMMLKESLEGRGYEVVLLRGTESFPSEDEIIREADLYNMEIKKDKINNDNVFHAYERTIYANVLHRKTPFALMLSLHINAMNKGYEYIRGTELYYCKDNSCVKQSSLLAGLLKDKITGERSEADVKIRGDAWDDAYIVTKFTEMPSVLVEMGYGTNEDDAKLILDDGWRHSFVKSLSDAIDEYISVRND